MKCAACYNEMVKKKGEVDLKIEGKLYLVRNISLMVGVVSTAFRPH